MMLRLRWLAIALPAFTAAVHAQAPVRSRVSGAPAGVTAFVGVTVVPMDTERLLPSQTVLVTGGRITVLGPVNQVEVPKGAVQIDGRGKFLIPGLADMHAHVLRRPDDTSRVEYTLLRWLSEGITTVRNMDVERASAQTEFVLRLKARAAAGELWSPRINTGVSLKGAAKLTSDSIRTAIAAYKAAGYDFLKVHGERIETIKTLVAASRQAGGLPVVGHSPKDGTWEQVMTSGMQSIEHLFHGWPLALLGPSGFIPDQFRPGSHWSLAPQDTVQARLATMRQAGVWVCPTYMVYFDSRAGTTLSEWLGPLFLAQGDRAVFKQVMESQPLKLLHDAGIGLLLGSDKIHISNFQSNYNTAANIHVELQVLVQGGLTPYQALATGTRNVAVYLKTLDETGTIAVGKRADLVLLNGNPLESIANTKQPAGVMIGGRWLDRAELDRRVAEMRAIVVSSP